MNIHEISRLTEEFQNLNDIIASIQEMQKMPVVEVGEILSDIEDSDLIEILDKFTPEQQGLIVAEFHVSKQLSLFQSVSKKRFAIIFEKMPSEDRADLYQHLSHEEQAAISPFLSKPIRENVLSLSSYPPETAGGIMSTDFATVQKGMSCKEALQKVRDDSPSQKTIYYIYVTDNDQHLQGFITLKDLVIADPQSSINQITITDYVSATVEEDQEDVARRIDKYDLVAIPVVNKNNQLVGIVTHDEALDILREEQTEDMEKFMGLVPDKEVVDYSNTSVLDHFRKRVVWLASLAVIGILSGMVIHYFEEALSTLIILALFMPMVADTGGNTGSQAATVVIRALALGQVSLKNWINIIFKEARISLILSVVIGVIAFGKVLFLTLLWGTEVPENYSIFYIAAGIALALSLQVISATLIGAGLPLVVKRFGGDPAVAASPAITTMVDVTGLLIYFSIAMILFF